VTSKAVLVERKRKNPVLSPSPTGGRRRPRTLHSPGCVPTHFAGGDPPEADGRGEGSSGPRYDQIIAVPPNKGSSLAFHVQDLGSLCREPCPAAPGRC
jgi:hypothetical protein